MLKLHVHDNVNPHRCVMLDPGDQQFPALLYV